MRPLREEAHWGLIRNPPLWIDKLTTNGRKPFALSLSKGGRKTRLTEGGTPMYLIRRVFRCKPGTARRAAEQITKIGKAYENAGQRSPIRVYTSGGTVPGPANTVYMDWTAPVLESPYREGNPMPEEIRPVAQQMNEFVEESYIEFYEMFEPQ